jgi:hypothetical protein
VKLQDRGGGLRPKLDNNISSNKHYNELLKELKEKGKKLADQYIPNLYIILRDEEKIPPEDCRAKIEHDCLDLWSRATIRKYLPPEAMNPKKQIAGKVSTAEKKKRKAAMLVVATTTGGNENSPNVELNESFPIVQRSKSLLEPI